MDLTLDVWTAAFFAATTYDYATDAYSPITDTNEHPYGAFYLYNETPMLPPFDKKQRGTVHINVTKNETLINLRKKLENPNSLFDNIIVLYIDAVSRNRFLSTLPKTSKFINRFMSYNSEETEFGKFKSFQFFKYHSTGTFTQPNAQPMFYGNSMFSGSGVQITKYLKENGYITSMVFDQCVFEVFFD